MNSADYINDYLAKLKAQALSLMLIAWKIALACVGWAYVFGGAGQYSTPNNRKARDWQNHPTIKSKCQVLRDNDPKPNCSGCKWFPGGLLTRFFDCRGFTRWILKLVYGWDLKGAGCTSQWNTESNWKAKGEISDGIPKDTLCCVFYYKKDSKGRRTKTLEHTGFYLNGETVECSNGVQYSKTLNKKWEVWAIPMCVESGDIQPVEPPKEPEKQQEGAKPVSYKTIRRGNYGELVKQCQTILQKLGYDLGICGIDGDFGQATEKAVKQFQKDHGLKVDGVVGQNTWAALMAADTSPAPEKLYTVTVTGLKKAVADKLVSEYGGTITEQKG